MMFVLIFKTVSARKDFDTWEAPQKFLAKFRKIS